jgi:diaminohydroxyphosphoribosylaminopyrimidine deaminase/5-amino-6-(5-phosphoribosylamino)uracil reductase
MRTAEDVIRMLGLAPHPEGGHFRETFRDSVTIDGKRAASTAIYYLLARGERSHWHRVDAAEVWHWYAGAALRLGIADDIIPARWITLGHILRVTQKRPFVTLKIATDAEGSIAPGDGTAPRWVTGPQARAAGHKLRAEADAILIGAGTLRADNPELTCRLPGLANRSPVRVVLAGRAALDPSAKLFETASLVPVLIVRAGAARPFDHDLAAAGADVLELPDHRIPAVLEMLAARGITRLLVEGGPTVWRSFADAHLIDEVALFMAGPPDGQKAALALQHHLGRLTLQKTDCRPVGSDTMWRLRPTCA